MFLHKLTLNNFKNYGQAEFEFCGKINCIVGNNGVGKTNLLDAIHYLSFCKSYFNPADTQNIRHEEDFFSIHSSWFRNGDMTVTLQCIQKRNQRKKFLINKQEYERLADHIGLFPLVMISPYDRDLINDGSEVRRKYFDSVISQFDKVYLDRLIIYNKALAHRNSLLKSFHEKKYFDRTSLEIWDEQLITLGEGIHEVRKKFFGEFIPLFREYFRIVSSDSEDAGMIYQSQLSSGSYREMLENARDRDLAAQYSLTGIHKDDIDFLTGSYPIKRYGSQGQQKSFVVAMKLAQFEYTRKIKGFKPLLLLDDIFDKLDDRRVSQLIRMVSEDNFGQVFITDTQEENIRRIFEPMEIEHKIFFINTPL